MRNLAIKSIIKLKKVVFRNRIITDRSVLSNILSCKSLRESLKNKSGRNETGRITIRHRGGRNKRQLNFIDYSGKLNKYSDSLYYISSEYDANRSGLLSRIVTKKFDFGYRLSVSGQELVKYEGKTFLGNVLKLKDIRSGSSIYNIDGKYCRGAGVFGRLLRVEGSRCLVRLGSKKLKWFSSNVTASLGENSNENFKLQKKGKAGANR